VLAWAAKGSRAGEKPVMIFATRGWEDEYLGSLNDDERRRLIIREARRYFPAFPEEPLLTKLFRWDRAVNLLSPEQFTAIQDLLKNHMHEVSGLPPGRRIPVSRGLYRGGSGKRQEGSDERYRRDFALTGHLRPIR
jgi:hypothetical protein